MLSGSGTREDLYQRSPILSKNGWCDLAGSCMSLTLQHLILLFKVLINNHDLLISSNRVL